MLATIAVILLSGLTGGAMSCNPGVGNVDTRFYTLLPGEQIPLEKKADSRWYITRHESCRAVLSCDFFYIPKTSGCQTSSLEVIDGEAVKLRLCGFSNNLEYVAKGETFLDIRSTIKGM